MYMYVEIDGKKIHSEDGESPSTIYVRGNEEGAEHTHRCATCGETTDEPADNQEPCDGSDHYAECPECSGHGGCSECDGDDQDCDWCAGSGECGCDGGEIEIHDWEPIGLTWLNSAAIHVEEDRDEVTVTISCGDPRGAFAFTIRRLPEDADRHAGRLIMHTPYPGESLPHMKLTELHKGTYVIGD